MKQYIDANKLKAEIERRLKIVEPHKDAFESAAACRQELIWMKEHITSLQQEQPEVEFEKEEFVGVAESPLKTFPRVNDFECGGGYRR